jgi:glucose-6-phosphate 1-dehydrogenase
MEAWRIVQPVIEASPKPEVYERGTMGPETADRLLGTDWGWLTR